MKNLVIYSLDTKKTCGTCKEEKCISEFYKRLAGRYNVETFCKKCSDIKRKLSNRRNPLTVKNRKLKAAHNINLSDFNEMLEGQNGVCMICKKPETAKPRGRLLSLSVDHCHETNIIRGLLCGNCNQGLGRFKDSPELMRKAAEYIEFYKDRNN
jgi:hypothetical protein